MYDNVPGGATGLVWDAVGTGSSTCNGGWGGKTLQGLNSKKSYMFTCMVRRTTSSSSGTYYFGCDHVDTYNLNGGAGTHNGNPYFISRNIGNFEIGVWYLYVGIVHHDAQLNATGFGGTWNCSTGKKLGGAVEFKWKPGGSTQNHRNFLCYSADGHIQFYDPGVYEINGTEPTVAELVEKGCPTNNSHLNGYMKTVTYVNSSTWTKPTGCKQIKVTVTGGGGGGGSHNSDDSQGGGGAGGTSIKTLDVSSVTSSTVTIGSGGSGACGNTNVGAGTGGTSSFGPHCSASGGLGPVTWAVGGRGGSATGGDINIYGGDAACGNIDGGGNEESGGTGGASIWGSGGTGATAWAVNHHARAYGSGGGGGHGTKSDCGSNGMSGIIVVEEFY
jgi:hypothetical protein